MDAGRVSCFFVRAGAEDKISDFRKKIKEILERSAKKLIIMVNRALVTPNANK